MLVGDIVESCGCARGVVQDWWYGRSFRVVRLRMWTERGRRDWGREWLGVSVVLPCVGEWTGEHVGWTEEEEGDRVK